MGSKNKLKRFKENETFTNLFQPSREVLLADKFEMKGNWGKCFFKNNNPVILELGCGKGEYSLALAKEFPNRNFIGIDIKGARIWRGAKTAFENKMSNVGFIRMQIELLDKAFAKDEVSEIWITFPDPQIKFKRTKHRLTNKNFLNLYKKVLIKEGVIHLKTDSEFMYGYTLGLLHGLDYEILYTHHNIYKNTESPKELTEIQTFYEIQFLEINKSITYIKFKLK